MRRSVGRGKLLANWCIARRLNLIDPQPSLVDGLDQIVPPSFDYAFAAVVDDCGQSRVIAKNGLNFFAAASLAKLFVAAAVLRRVRAGEMSLETVVPVDQLNRVGDPSGLGVTERPDALAEVGTATLKFLLCQMLNRSSNTAANVLIDMIGRDAINSTVILPAGWSGSEVTRKFVPRNREPVRFAAAPASLTCPLHVADLLHRAAGGRLVDPTHDNLLLSNLLDGVRHGELSMAGDAIPGAQYHHKIGSLQAVDRRRRLVRWQHDAGVLRICGSNIVLAVLTRYRPPTDGTYFPLAKVQQLIFEELLSTGSAGKS